MPSEGKGFTLFTDSIPAETRSELSYEQMGLIFHAILAHAEGFDMPEMDQVCRISFVPIKQAMDRAAENYRKVCEINKKNGAKGGRPKKPNGLNKKPPVTKEPNGLNENRDHPAGSDDNPKNPTRTRTRTKGMPYQEEELFNTWRLDDSGKVEHVPTGELWKLDGVDWLNVDSGEVRPGLPFDEFPPEKEGGKSE